MHDHILIDIIYCNPNWDTTSDAKLIELINKANQENVLIWGYFKYANEINWKRLEASGKDKYFMIIF
jgi:hypothetical protein